MAHWIITESGQYECAGHGEFIPIINETCSSCHETTRSANCFCFKYCPNCGEKMSEPIEHIDIDKYFMKLNPWNNEGGEMI